LYGFHKQIAEWCVRRHSASWLIVRLAGMVGPGLRKNPVFDILNDQPLRISPESRYQFMSTDDAAEITWQLVGHGVRDTVWNVCGDGLISPREIADIIGRRITVHPEAEHAAPRIVDVNIERISRIRPIPATRSTIERFLLERRVP
jgi:nucleoside-diphosphate-sugar epimerase